MGARDGGGMAAGAAMGGEQVVCAWVPGWHGTRGRSIGGSGGRKRELGAAGKPGKEKKEEREGRKEMKEKKKSEKK